MEQENKCLTCGSPNVRYVAEVGAPGIGQDFECDDCGEHLRKIGGAFVIPGDCDPSCLELTEADVY